MSGTRVHRCAEIRERVRNTQRVSEVLRRCVMGSADVIGRRIGQRSFDVGPRNGVICPGRPRKAIGQSTDTENRLI